MPGMNGIEAAEHIARERPTPIIFISADHGAAARCAESANAVGVLIKPVSRAVLEGAIASALKHFLPRLARAS